MRKPVRRYRSIWLGVTVILLTLLGSDSIAGANHSHAGQLDGTAPWTSFGFNASHSSFNAAAVSVTPVNASTLAQAWQFVTPGPTTSGQPGIGFDGSPVVADGLVLIGSNTGVFYALNEDSGAVVWSLNAGFIPKFTCGAAGIEATATVASDPISGKPTVYFAGANGVLWAVDVASGTVDWSSKIFPTPKSSADFIWGSPTVFGGRVYIGIASGCDNPLSRGGVASFSQATGAHQATFWTVAATAVGGAIWSTPAASSAGVFVTTGNGNQMQPNSQGLSNSIVRLNPTTLKATAHWTVPGIATLDDDFGGSPTLFQATIAGKVTPMVGACNKNGFFYAWSQSALGKGPIWSDQLGNPAMQPNNACLATAGWNGADLFITTNSSNISGVTYPAVARELDPATGRYLWQSGLSDGPVLGNTAIDGAGVLAAITYSKTSPATTNKMVLMDQASGAVVGTYPTTDQSGGGPIWADGYLFFDGSDGVLHELTTP